MGIFPEIFIELLRVFSKISRNFYKFIEIDEKMGYFFLPFFLNSLVFYPLLFRCPLIIFQSLQISHKLQKLENLREIVKNIFTREYFYITLVK